MDENEYRKQKAEKIIKIYNCVRLSLLVILIALLCFGLSKIA